MDQTAVNGKKPLTRPEKPDEDTFRASLKKAEKDHADTMAKLMAIKNKLDSAIPPSSDSPSAKHRAELLSQLKDIRERQSLGKTSRNKLLDQIRKEDIIVKDLIAQQKTAKSRVQFKSIEDLDKEIERLHKQINSGSMKIVDEKRALDTISGLSKQRKNFAGFEESQKVIDSKKANIKQLREQLDDNENKALSERYNKIQAELDEIKAQQDDVYKNINSLREERKRLQDDQQAKYMAIREIKDNYFEQTRAVQKWEYEARQRARDKKKAEEERYQQEKKKARAQQILDEASDKAYLDEIRRAHSLLHFLDPSYSTEKTPLQAPSRLHATPQRQVDGPEMKGVRISKKDEEDYFAGTGGKKGKKAKKTAARDNPTMGKFSCPPAVMEDCVIMGIDPPLSAADIPAVKEKVLEKLGFWKKNQDAETERNIAKAKKELERIEAEESIGSSYLSEPTVAHDNINDKTTKVLERGNTLNEITSLQSSPADATSEIKAISLNDEE